MTATSSKIDEAPTVPEIPLGATVRRQALETWCAQHELTERQRELLTGVVLGEGKEALAARLRVSLATVDDLVRTFEVTTKHSVYRAAANILDDAYAAALADE